MMNKQALENMDLDYLLDINQGVCVWYVNECFKWKLILTKGESKGFCFLNLLMYKVN